MLPFEWKYFINKIWRLKIKKKTTYWFRFNRLMQNRIVMIHIILFTLTGKLLKSDKRLLFWMNIITYIFLLILGLKINLKFEYDERYPQAFTKGCHLWIIPFHLDNYWMSYVWKFVTSRGLIGLCNWIELQKHFYNTIYCLQNLYANCKAWEICSIRG